MEAFTRLFEGVFEFRWEYLLMYAIGGILIYLAIAKDYEPMLLLPIGLGAILVNLPFGIIWETAEGKKEILQVLYDAGIITELFPILIFIGIGAMTDFRPLFSAPKMIFFGAAAQFGIFFTIIMALFANELIPSLNYSFHDAATIGVIGTADGPTSIVVASQFAAHSNTPGGLVAPITVAAYSYMALVPIILPPVIRALTTAKERKIRMEYSGKDIPQWVMILFPILVAVITGIIAPISAPLIGFLMFGNLLRECGVLERLNKAAQNELSNIVTLLLGITIGGTMRYDKFLTVQTLVILLLGLIAFVFDTAGGVLFAKLINVFSKKKVNPMIGAAGISAFPMASRIVQRMAAKEDNQNFILMQAAGANVAGQLGSVIAGSMILSLVPRLSELIK